MSLLLAKIQDSLTFLKIWKFVHLELLTFYCTAAQLILQLKVILTSSYHCGIYFFKCILIVFLWNQNVARKRIPTFSHLPPSSTHTHPPTLRGYCVCVCCLAECTLPHYCHRTLQRCVRDLFFKTTGLSFFVLFYYV